MFIEGVFLGYAFVHHSERNAFIIHFFIGRVVLGERHESSYFVRVGRVEVVEVERLFVLFR